MCMCKCTLPLTTTTPPTQAKMAAPAKDAKIFQVGDDVVLLLEVVERLSSWAPHIIRPTHLPPQVHGGADMVVNYKWGKATHEIFSKLLSQKPIFELIQVRVDAYNLSDAHFFF